jgi:RNA polymerase sigma-70 factor (ECF subfamily)
VAVAEAEGPVHGLDLLDTLALGGDLDDNHLFHSARAELLARLGRPDEAAAAYRRALALAGTVAERRFLTRRLAEVVGTGTG